MRRSRFIIAFATSCLATSVLAQSEKAPEVSCPTQYELIEGNLCMKFSNGDIVLPNAPVAGPRYTNANCKKGYAIVVDNQCMNSNTGDIVFAEEKPPVAIDTAQR